jgi:hypothetical protein
MRRRDFITALGTAATWPLAARAQQPAKMKRIAYVNSAGNVSRISVSGGPFYRTFFEELSRLGYVEGQNLGVERYSGERRTERYAELARDVVTHREPFHCSRFSLRRPQCFSFDESYSGIGIAPCRASIIPI